MKTIINWILKSSSLARTLNARFFEENCELPNSSKNVNVWDCYHAAQIHRAYCSYASFRECPKVEYYAHFIIKSQEVLAAAHWVTIFKDSFAELILNMVLEASILTKDDEIGLFRFVEYDLYGSCKVKLRLVELGLVDEFLLSQQVCCYSREEFYADLPSSVKTEILL